MKARTPIPEVDRCHATYRKGPLKGQRCKNRRIGALTPDQQKKHLRFPVKPDPDRCHVHGWDNPISEEKTA